MRSCGGSHTNVKTSCSRASTGPPAGCSRTGRSPKRSTASPRPRPPQREATSSSSAQSHRTRDVSWPAPSALAAELEGSRLSLDGLDAEELESSTSSSDEGLPAAIRNVASRARAEKMGVHPIRVGERIVATLELYRTSDTPFEERERMLGRLAAAHIGIAVRLEGASRNELGANGRA